MDQRRAVLEAPVITVFFSYSHRDEAMRDELEVHLAMLQRQGVIEAWHDRRIGAGRDFAGTINERLEHADIILVLVSPYFLASDYCYDVELSRAMDRHEHGSARVIPVILDPCDWHEAPFGKLLAVPKDGKPISKYANMHDAFLEVVKTIRQTVGELGEGDPAEHQVTCDLPIGTGQAPHQSARSSNLRVTRTFSDQVRDDFLDESFTYISNFFENSLDELSTRSPEITTRFKRLSDARFTAFVYRNGQSISECCVRQDSKLGQGITYSANASSDNSYNEALSVTDDGYALLLKPMGMAMMSFESDTLSQHGAAEYLWVILMRPLQR